MSQAGSGPRGPDPGPACQTAAGASAPHQRRAWCGADCRSGQV